MDLEAAIRYFNRLIFPSKWIVENAIASKDLQFLHMFWQFITAVLFSAYTLFQVDMYRRRQKDREPRKRLSKEYRIIQNATTLGAKKLQAAKAKQSKDERLIMC